MMKKDEIAYLLLCLTLGANILLHGFSRLTGDHAAFAAYMDKSVTAAFSARDCTRSCFRLPRIYEYVGSSGSPVKLLIILKRSRLTR